MSEPGSLVQTQPRLRREAAGQARKISFCLSSRTAYGPRCAESLGLSPARAHAASSSRRRGSSAAPYVSFLALTAINPLTIVYFASVAASLSLAGVSARLAFVIGVGVASATWHALLALAAARAGRRMTLAMQRLVAIGGRLVVFGMAVRFALAV